MKRSLIILFGVLSLFVSAGVILPALAKVKDFGSMPENVVLFYTGGVCLAVFGLGSLAAGVLMRSSGTVEK